ncbi:MAG TPA: rhodanese-like domain-containing protein [Streptosporangiaceae bacterium]|jgi:rhodanese-related sulfurtransferase
MTVPFGGNIPAIDVTAVPDDGYLLDVREQDEWVAGHAPHAVHIPLGTLGERAQEIPADRDVYVVCRSGGRSAQATQALNQAGWKATNVSGGMHAWEAAARPMVSETGGPATVA